VSETETQQDRAATAAQSPPPQGGNGAAPPRLADGIELIGRYEDSGFKDPPYIARRADGQMIQMPGLLYLVAEEVNGERTPEEIAARVTEKLERGVAADDIQYLLDEKLRPLGVLAMPDGSSPEVQKADPLLGLKFRVAAVPARVTRALTTIFYPFFFPPVVLAVLGGLVAVDIWFFFIHGAAQSTRELLYNPILLLMVLGLVVVATALHEIGHATATRYGGAEPGVMGAGIYIVWPAFYTDVTDAYRLSRGGRLRVDLGGVYFNCIFVLGIVGAYALTGFEPLLVLVVVQHLQILQQFLPFLRLDGYYILSDLTGVPDMFQRIKPTLKSLMPWKDSHEKVEELKPWVRYAISGWVIALVPVLLLVFGMLVFNLPRMVATAWDSFWVQADRVGDSFDSGKELTGAVAVLQAGFLVLPIAGITATFARIGKRIGVGAWSWSADSAVRRGGLVASAGAAAALAAFVWFPNGEYRPIQPAEKGTIQGGVRQFNDVSTGRPGLTEQREQELGGAPTQREQRDENQPSDPEPKPSGQTNTNEEPTTTGETTTSPTTTAAEEPTTAPAATTTDTTATGTTTTGTSTTTTTTATTTAEQTTTGTSTSPTTTTPPTTTAAVTP
jgi:putative peptide zinc metalloprotease protein